MDNNGGELRERAAERALAEGVNMDKIRKIFVDRDRHGCAGNILLEFELLALDIVPQFRIALPAVVILAGKLNEKDREIGAKVAAYRLEKVHGVFGVAAGGFGEEGVVFALVPKVTGAAGA